MFSLQLLHGATHGIFFTLSYPMNYKEMFAAGQRGHVFEMLLEPWPAMLPVAAWERSNTRSLAREKTTDKEEENETGHRGQLLPDIFSKPECYNTQLKEISAGKSTDTLSLHISQGSDQSTAPGLQVLSCSKARLAQPAFPSIVFLHYQVCITVFSPATSYRAGGLLMLCMCMR